MFVMRDGCSVAGSKNSADWLVESKKQNIELNLPKSMARMFMVFPVRLGFRTFCTPTRDQRLVSSLEQTTRAPSHGLSWILYAPQTWIAITGL